MATKAQMVVPIRMILFLKQKSVPDYGLTTFPGCQDVELFLEHLIIFLLKLAVNIAMQWFQIAVMAILPSENPRMAGSLQLI
jgi:hypothetical protein